MASRPSPGTESLRGLWRWRGWQRAKLFLEPSICYIVQQLRGDSMRKFLFLAPLVLVASPILAQPMPQQLPPELTDPATVRQLATAAQAVSDAMLDINVGEVRAAIEGRE